MSANGSSSLRVTCPLGKCGEGSLCQHAAQVALATDAWGAVRAHPMGNGSLADDQAHNQVANNCHYVGKRRGEEKLPLEECTRAQEGKDDAQPRDGHGRPLLNPCPSVFFLLVQSVRQFSCLFCNMKFVCPSYGP